MRVVLGGNLIKYSLEGKSSFEIPLDEPTELFAILDLLSIPHDEAQIIIVNHKLADRNNITLNNEDDVIIYSVLAGG